MPFTLSAASIKNRRGVDPRLVDVSNLAIQLTLIDFGHGPHAGLRTAAEQHSLFLGGKTEADGYDNKSHHQSGKALDFYAYIDGAASWEQEHLAMVAASFFQAASILGVKIRWGGLWKSRRHPFYGWDMPHIELIEE